MGDTIHFKDLFPFETIPEGDSRYQPTGAGTYYPVSMTLDHVMDLAYRVKHWGGRFEGVTTTNSGFPDFIATDDPFNWSDELGFRGFGFGGDEIAYPYGWNGDYWDGVKEPPYRMPALRREELLLFGNNQKAWRKHWGSNLAELAEGYYASDLDGNPIETGNGFFELFGDVANGLYPLQRDSAGNLWPQIRLSLSAAPSTGSGFFAVLDSLGATNRNVKLRWADSDGLPVVYQVPVEFFGASTTITAADIFAREYWQYADSGGSPVWDATTGAELTDPFG